jgi:hypothetical protein
VHTCSKNCTACNFSHTNTLKPTANKNTWVASICHWSIPLYYSNVCTPWHAKARKHGVIQRYTPMVNACNPSVRISDGFGCVVATSRSMCATTHQNPLLMGVTSICHWSIPLYYSNACVPWHTSQSMHANKHHGGVSTPWHTLQSVPWQMLPAFANAGRLTSEYIFITPMLARFCCLLEGRCISLLPSLFLLFTGLLLDLLY